MKYLTEDSIKIKIAITLNKLLTSRKNSKIQTKDNYPAISYNQIALISDIRKATVSNTFNAITSPSAITLIKIINAMGYTLQDFTDIFISITETEIENFVQN